jgi:hypothetical protein
VKDSVHKFENLNGGILKLDKTVTEKQETDEIEKIKKEVPDFPSAKLLLSIIQKEYYDEFDRGKNLETRTGMFLAFAGAILVFVASNIKLHNLFTVKSINVLQALPYAFLIIFLLATLVCLIWSILCFIQVISTKTYTRLALDSFSENNLYNNAVLPEERVTVALIPLYKSCIDNYTKNNDKKVDWYKKGINLILLALIFTCLTYILLLFNS